MLLVVAELVLPADEVVEEAALDEVEGLDEVVLLEVVELVAVEGLDEVVLLGVEGVTTSISMPPKPSPKILSQSPVLAVDEGPVLEKIPVTDEVLPEEVPLDTDEVPAVELVPAPDCEASFLPQPTITVASIATTISATKILFIVFLLYILFEISIQCNRRIVKYKL